MSRRLVRLFLSAFVMLPLLAHPANGRSEKMIAEKIEWTWEVTPDRRRPELPDVLLVGDSITRNYFPAVTQDLAGKANVYLFATSASLGDARLAPQLKEFFAMAKTHFRVIHFNNGMHGWGFTEAEYQQAFPALVRVLRAEAKGAKLIWANTTPVRKDNPDGATNARIAVRNEAAASFAQKEKIPLDDQHAVIEQHPDLYNDDVHPNEKASAMQGRQAADMIEKLLQE